MDIIAELNAAIGARHVVTGSDCERFANDFTGKYKAQPLAVARPGSTAEVSACVRIAAAAAVPVVAISGNTGLNGGSHAPGQLMISLGRLNRVPEVRPAARLAVVDAGVILSSLHDAADAQDLIFPMSFGARGSCMIGGMLSTNAGGSNVLRYGNSRDLCLGVEVVLPDGRVLNLMSQLHKDNTGYDLRDLFIGAEGTLGIITAAVLKLFPKPRAYATATVAVRDLPVALDMLNDLQEATAGGVEAFEYMPGNYLQAYARHFPDRKQPFERSYPTNLLVEVGATAARDATPNSDGSIPVQNYLEAVLARMIDDGRVLDAVVARSDAQRREMWHRREAAGELTYADGPAVLTDVSVPLDRVPEFLDRARKLMNRLEPGADDITVSHLGDGNVHFAVVLTRNDPGIYDTILEGVEDIALDLAGSFSAEHGIGLSKLGSMRRRKDPLALEIMGTLKAALDPQNLMNPGKVLP